MRIGEMELRVYTLSDGRRVIESNDLARFFGFPDADTFQRETAEIAANLASCGLLNEGW
jgi:hypothetical protein